MIPKYHDRSVAVIIDKLPDFDREAAMRVCGLLANNGYVVRTVTVDEFCAENVHSLGFLLIVPCAASLPAVCAAPLRDYATQGGQVLTLGGPLFHRQVRRVNGAWQREPADERVADTAVGGEMAGIVMEGFVPAYKVYPLYGEETFLTEPDQPVYRGKLCAPEQVDVICPVARPHGAGYRHRRNNRYIPLVQVAGEGGWAEGRRGAAAFFMLSATEGRNASTSGTRPGSVSCTTTGSVAASIGIVKQDLLSVAGMSELLLAMVGHMRRGLFLFEGGSDSFVYVDGEEGTLGASVLNVSQDFVQVEVRVTIGTSDGVVLTETLPLLAAPRNVSDVSLPWRGQSQRGDYSVVVELLHEGAVIDAIRHEAAVLETDLGAPAHRSASPGIPDRDDFVTVKDGRFRLGGKPWYPVGMNYWPSYSPGLEPTDYWSGMFDGRFYDPLEIERDLAYMEETGINCLFTRLDGNVFDRSVPQLLDFIGRCGKHGMKLGLAFPAAMSPLYYNGAAVRRLIDQAKLSENSVIFCFDIIWEFGGAVAHPHYRHYWNADWGAWIAERYGSLANAERDWGVRISPDEEGLPAGPTQEQLTSDGAWRIMTAAYRRFLDDLLSRKWNEAIGDLKRVVPRHLICCRQGPSSPQDVSFTAVSKHIDFVCPEGYYALSQGNRIPLDDDGYHTACFISRYLDYSTGGLPIVWSEFGYSLTGVRWAYFEWDHARLQPVAGSLEKQAAYVELYLRMALETGVSGVAPWWWPGGFRPGENSDFGFVGQDGVLRPAGELLRRYAPALSEYRGRYEPDEWFVADRDAHAGGHWHICYGEGRDAYARARQAGRRLGVRSAGTGTTSANTPLVAVGNVPYDGGNPPKYLNAEFNRVTIRDANGGVYPVCRGETVSVPEGVPLDVEISAGNLQEAEWLTPAHAGEAGGVCVVSAPGSELAVRIPIAADVPRFGDAEIGRTRLCAGVAGTTRVSLRMEADKRMSFGEIFTFTLQGSKTATEGTDES